MANKNTFAITIDGTSYSTYIRYPVTISKKKIDESLDICTITLTRLSNDKPFKPNLKVKLSIYSNEILQEDLYFLLMSDVTTQIRGTSFYEHKLNLIEFTQILDHIILPDCSITRLQPFCSLSEYTDEATCEANSGTWYLGYLPTLKDVSERILDLVEEVSGLILLIDVPTQILLDAIDSPEFTFNRYTALEALRMVFSLAKAVPTMISFTTLGSINLSEFLNETVTNYSYKQEAYDPQTYKTALFSNVNNFIAGENDSIIEPANGWITPRSNTGFEISNNYGLIPTSRPVYKIQKIDFRIQLKWIKISLPSGNVLDSAVIDYDIIPQEYFKDELIDWTNFIYEKKSYDLLPDTEVINSKGMSFSYEQGKPNIINITHIPASPGFWSPTYQAYKNIIYYKYNSLRGISDYIKPEYVAAISATLTALGYEETSDSGWKSFIDINFSSTYSEYVKSIVLNNINLYDLQFRIVYSPFINTNLYTFRERNYQNSTEIPSFQYYNQQASVLNSDVLADLHDKTIKRGTGLNLNLSYTHQNYSDQLIVGTKFNNYIITSVDLTYFLYGIKAIYNLDEYYAKLQKYMAVLEQYRQYSIPNENIVARQKTYNRFAKFSSIEAATNTSNITSTYYLGVPEDVEINIFRYSYESPQFGIALPTTNFAFNNSMVFEATMADNISAGVQSEYLDANKRKDFPVLYANNISGRIEPTETHVIMFCHNFDNISLAASYLLPYYGGVFNKNIFSLSDTLEKDARERMSFSLQLHHIDTTGKIYINKSFVKYNGLIGGTGLNNSGLFYALFGVSPQQKESVGSADLNKLITATFTSGSSGSIILPTITNNTASDAVAHGLVKSLDGGLTFEVLYWVDETVAIAATSPQYYINFSDIYNE